MPLRWGAGWVGVAKELTAMYELFVCKKRGRGTDGSGDCSVDFVGWSSVSLGRVRSCFGTVSCLAAAVLVSIR